MEFTTHLLQRMNKRGLTKKMIELTIDIGIIKGDKYVTNKKILLKI